MGKYFSELKVGETFTTPARTITETDVSLFSGLSGDYNPLHSDDTYAKTTVFGEKIVHGLLGISIATGLIFRTGIFDGTTIAFLGINDWKFQKPIFIGDTIYVKMTISETRKSKKENRGIVTRQVALINQREEVVQSGVLPIMLKDNED
ncbi:MaoC/PaaZ C-terminal domain-containing protein [Salipaludibacillus sp. CF4.18]|uniref:MaoC/PaaZ C-terminal domain-containing protein n=1 Tax=Salipaludibacillus sp. CF4.18 TaxID=3373081 RepID=UPI003EE5CA63